MEQPFDFNDLFVLDMANNHQGSVEHGLAIIRGVAEVVRRHGVHAAVKFQFRHLDSFVHPAHREASDNKHIGRFLSTRLEREQFQVLLDEVRKHGLLSMCTPFDEESVALIEEMGFDLLKVASCSAKDWPLLARIADANRPVIFSTGGLDLQDVDNLASFFDHRGTDWAVMHCVSIYPPPPTLFHMNQISVLRHRYPGRTVGWSTHEDPDDTLPIAIAVAKGARIFERHVGVETDEVKLNAYSSTPEQLDAWLSAYHVARELCGSSEWPERSKPERESIDSLRRGVYVRKPIKENQAIDRSQVYFAMPYLEGQLESGEWRDGILSARDFSPDAPLMREQVTLPEPSDVLVLKHAVHEVKALLNEARIPLDSSFKVEYSHHYGVQRFREVGAVIIECMNREYCKKLIVQLPRQRHPSHFHTLKEETFQVLYGDLHVDLDGMHHRLVPGQTLLVQPGVWHSFRTDSGVVFEEISTTHHSNDSTYRDKAINQLASSERKTRVDHWGRFQLDEILG